MFRGINSATLDAKGRMAVPARFRETVAATCGGNLILTIDMRDRCLLLYPLPEWEVVQRRLEDLSNINPQARLLQRLLIGHATDMGLDAQGRINVPAKLRKYAGLKKNVVVVGQGNKLEIWEEEHWDANMEQWLSDESGNLLSEGDAVMGLSV